MGNKSMRFDVSGWSGNCPRDFIGSYNAVRTDGGNLQDLWVRGYVRWDAPNTYWPTSHIKMVDGQGSGGIGQYYFQPEPSRTGHTLPSRMVPAYDGSGRNRARIPSGQLEYNRWYCFEVHWKTDTAPYIFDAWMDGVQIWQGTPLKAGGLETILFGVINCCGTPSVFNLSHWWDGFAVSTSRTYPACKIEIGNNAVYGRGSEKWQEPISLADRSVQFRVDLTGLGPGPYYLWITNNRNERSSAYSVKSDIQSVTEVTR